MFKLKPQAHLKKKKNSYLLINYQSIFFFQPTLIKETELLSRHINDLLLSLSPRLV